MKIIFDFITGKFDFPFRYRRPIINITSLVHFGRSAARPSRGLVAFCSRSIYFRFLRRNQFRSVAGQHREPIKLVTRNKKKKKPALVFQTYVARCGRAASRRLSKTIKIIYGTGTGEKAIKIFFSIACGQPLICMLISFGAVPSTLQTFTVF